MKQAELQEKIKMHMLGNQLDDIITLIDQHVTDVIGDDEEVYSDEIEYYDYKVGDLRNQLRAEQRKRANL